MPYLCSRLCQHFFDLSWVDAEAWVPLGHSYCRGRCFFCCSQLGVQVVDLSHQISLLALPMFILNLGLCEVQLASEFLQLNRPLRFQY